MIKLEQEGRSWYFNPESLFYVQVDRDERGYVVNLFLKFTWHDTYTSLEFEGKDAEDNFERIEYYLKKSA